MKDRSISELSSEALSRSLAEFANPSGPDLLARTQAFLAWQAIRRNEGVWFFTRTLTSAPGTTTEIHDINGKRAEGINFASQDYLSLAAHPAVHEAGSRALKDFGPHSAGSPVLLGNTTLSHALERAIGDLLQTEHVLLFPTGWGAGFGSVIGLVRPDDHIVMDRLAHACLQQGAFASSRKVHRHEHLDVEGIRSILREVRAKDTRNAILVITEGLYSMDSDIPDIRAIQEACREHQATLLVDVAHDLGALGPGGTGSIGTQDLLGQVDLVMGSFSKTFASNGGFLATRSEAVTSFVKHFGGPHIFSNALSPVQSAIVLEAMRIVRSTEGDALRAALMTAVNALRGAFAERGLECIGLPSAIVPVPVGDERLARIMSRLLMERQFIANMVEYPGVPVGKARVRMQVMARHTPEQARRAAEVVLAVRDDARSILARYDERQSASV